MALSLDPGQHSLDIIEIARETRAQIKTGGSKGRCLLREIEYCESCAKRVVHDRLERRLPPPGHLLEARRDILLQRKSRPHNAMFSN